MNQKFFLILPDIRSCHNVGAMFRTADAFAVDKLVLAGYTAAPPKPQIDKVALGAQLWIPFEQIERAELASYLETLQKSNIHIVALEQSEVSVPLEEMSIPQNKDVALIVGNEVDGISEEILKYCDEVVHINMLGRKKSLNVSVATGIMMQSIRAQLS